MDQKKSINWGPVIFLTTYQILLLISLPIYLYYYTPSIAMWAAGVALLYLTGLSITGGYHRYYSHKSYRTGNVVESILLFLGSMTAQGSALRWAFDHRIHHAYVDTDEDPYSIKKGFWYAHFLWIIDKPREIEPRIVSDLIKNKLVMFQHRHYKLCMILSNAVVTLFCGWVFNDYLGAFFIVLWLRLFALHHFTWFINSLAHMWGDKPFSKELSAVDNYFLSMLTFGEGYHNYHHTFANDYRNGIRWFHFDPTKWLIWSLNQLGLASNLKRMDKVTIQKRIVLEQKTLLLERITQLCIAKKDELEASVLEISDRIVAKISQFENLYQEYRLTKKEKQATSLLNELRSEIRSLKKSLRDDWKLFIKVAKDIQHLKTNAGTS